MIFAMRLTRDFKLDFFEAVGHSGLVMLKFSYVSVGIGEDLRHGEKLTRLIGKHNAKTKNPSPVNQRLVYKCGDCRYVNVATAYNRNNFFVTQI